MLTPIYITHELSGLYDKGMIDGDTYPHGNVKDGGRELVLLQERPVFAYGEQMTVLTRGQRVATCTSYTTTVTCSRGPFH
jgi:hypothetical protein